MAKISTKPAVAAKSPKKSEKVEKTTELLTAAKAKTDTQKKKKISTHKTEANDSYGTGRRKTSTARVFLKPQGSGLMTVNGMPVDKYFTRKVAVMLVNQPLNLLSVKEQFDLKITVKGGGVMGQAGAIRHGLTRALIAHDETYNISQVGKPAPGTALVTMGGIEVIDTGEFGSETAENKAPDTWRKRLRRAKYVTRDPRKVERKKYGRRKARKLEQYSKR